MRTKLTTLMKEKFGIKNPHFVLKELKKIGKIDCRSIRRPFEDTPPEKFDLEVIKKYIEYVSSKSNSSSIQYDPIYWMYRKNVTYEEGVKIIAENKVYKRTDKEGFIKRHGLEKGLELFEKFQQTSSYSTSDEWFKERYGDKWKEVKNYKMKKRTRRCVEFWIDKGFTLEEAEKRVSHFQKTTSGVHREYYEKMGYSEEEIDIIIYEINKKKKNHCRNVKFLKEKYPDTWREVYRENSQKYREKMEQNGTWIAQSAVDEFKKYKELVMRYTRENLLFYGDLVENLELRSRQYHLDHKYSIKMGFLNDIDPKIISSIVNLEIIPGKINSSKRMKCSISKTQLLKDYQKFKEDYENHKN